MTYEAALYSEGYAPMCRGDGCRTVEHPDLWHPFADGLCEECQGTTFARARFREDGREHASECGTVEADGTPRDPEAVCYYPKGSTARREWVAGWREIAEAKK